MTLDKRWAEAEAAYVRALEIDPESLLMARNLESVLAQSGRPRPAILADLAELRSIDTAVAKGDWSAHAVSRCARLLERRPTFLMARFLYGSLLLANQRAAEAALELERVIAVDGRRAAPRVNLGAAYAALGRAAQAEAQFRAALAIDPTNTTARARLSALGRTPK